MNHLIRVILGNALAALIGFATPGAASAQTGGMPDYGLRWSVIGSPGNAPAVIPNQFPFFPPTIVGGVGYQYRVAQTEVTIGQWYEFATTYAPHMRGDLNVALSMRDEYGIQFSGMSNGVPSYSLSQGFANWPVFIRSRAAARYMNWLHNGKPDAAHARPEDFERGAYDVSTFGVDPNGIVTDQFQRSPGARFFFPSRDEWTKAVYFDPNRYGPGQPGYWTQPNGTDTPLVHGRPEDGGQTNAIPWPSGVTLPRNVGSYAGVQTPWGLLDASGGGQEFLDDELAFSFGRYRFTAGSGWNEFSDDRIGTFGSADVGTWGSIRVASIVPSPSAVVVIAVPGACALARRRR